VDHAAESAGSGTIGPQLRNMTASRKTSSVSGLRAKWRPPQPQLMHARSYSSMVGGFLQTDPISTPNASAMALNKYKYVSGNPLTNIDPDGRFKRPVHQGLSAAAGLSSRASWGVANVDTYGPLPAATWRPDEHSLGSAPGMEVATKLVDSAIDLANAGSIAAAGAVLRVAIHAAQDDPAHRSANGTQLTRAEHACGALAGNNPDTNYGVSEAATAAVYTATIIAAFEAGTGMSASSAIEASCNAGGDCRSPAQVAEDVQRGWDQMDSDFGRSLPSPDNPAAATASLQAQGLSVRMNGADMTSPAGAYRMPSVPGTRFGGIYRGL
jgi:RHS repeat-associated protein